MIFYDIFSMGPLITKSSKLERESNSLSPHKKKRAPTKHHHHQIMEVADIAIAPLKEFVRDSARLVKMHETRPTRVYAHREQDGVRCVLSINIIIIIIIIALFFCVSSPPCLSILGKSNTYIYISRRCLALGPHQKRSLSTSFKRDDRVYHVWVRLVLRETGLVSVSLRSLFTLNQQSHQYSEFSDERLNTQIYGSFFPVAWRSATDDARAEVLY